MDTEHVLTERTRAILTSNKLTNKRDPLDIVHNLCIENDCKSWVPIYDIQFMAKI